MPTHTLRILHLSDLHERVSLPWMDQERKNKIRLMAASRRSVLGANLEEILLSLRGQVDLVCFTGDLADWGIAEEYVRVTALVERVLACLELPRSAFYVVPGNHDVSRKVEEDTWKQVKELVWSERAALSRWMAGAGNVRGLTDSHRDGVLKRTANYHAWVETALGRPELLPVKGLHDHLGWRHTLRLKGHPFDTHLIGFNSAWLAGADGESGSLLLSQGQLDLLTTDENGDPLPGFRLAMVHHPLSDLADHHDAQRRLSDTVDLLLHGHQHTPIAQEQNDPDRSLRILAAGSLYEGDAGDRWVNSFHHVVVTLTDEGKPLSYDITFYGWSPRGHWHRDNSFYRMAENGKLRWLTPLGEEEEERAERRHRARSVRPEIVERIFVGREEELLALGRCLFRPEGKPVVVTSLQGMAGVGKSCLVEQFYQRHALQFPGDFLRVVLTESSTVDTLISELFDAVKVPAGQLPISERLRQVLCASRALVHLENVDDRGRAEVVSDLAQRLAGARLIVTGRYSAYQKNSQWEVVSLAPFDETTGWQQLKKELQAQRAALPAEQEGRQLVSLLGRLPLAIHLAAGYLAADYSCQEFREKLVAQGLSLELYAVNDKDYIERMERTLAATIEISTKALQARIGVEKMSALWNLGYAALEGFSSSLGAALLGFQGVAAKDALIEARNYGLLEQEAAGQAAERWWVHPLVAEHFRNQGAAQNAWERLSAWFLAKMNEEKMERAVRWKEAYTEPGLQDWLRRVPAKEAGHVLMKGYEFARSNGPYTLWIDVSSLALGMDKNNRKYLWRAANIGNLLSDYQWTMQCLKQMKIEAHQDKDSRDFALALGLEADVIFQQGQFEEGLRIRREEVLPIYERLGDERERAVCLEEIARMLMRQGEKAEALRIRRDEVLPVLAGLDDEREQAVCLGGIADVLVCQGEVAEALRIRRDEVLPTLKRLGNLSECAMCLGKIADILESQRQVEEALRIRREEILPVYERLGDERERAVCLEEIARMLVRQGEVAEALRIRRDEVLPIWTGLGDKRERAVCLGKIADVLASQEVAEEALRIYRDEVLPVLERLGDERLCAVCLGKIADVLESQGQVEEALRIRQEEVLPVHERLGDERDYAVCLGKIVDVLASRGQVEEALRIRRDEVLPALERSGDIQALIVGKSRLAIMIISAKMTNKIVDAYQLLIEAYKIAKQHGYAVETNQLRQLLLHIGIPEELLR